MPNGTHQTPKGVKGRIWPAVATGGAVLAAADLAELEATPGSNEVAGNIEVKRWKEVTWLLVKAHEGVRAAAHRALEIYLEARGNANVAVLRRASAEAYVGEGVEWELVIDFRPVKEDGPRSG